MGRVWKFGDNVNTDLITPGRYNLTTNPTELAKYCFCEVRPEFPKEVHLGDFVVGGVHFGSGSSRETAPLAIKASGIKAIIASSFARIFYRNAVNIGLPILIADTSVINDGDQLDVDLRSGVISIPESGIKIDAQGLPEFLLAIMDEGGIVAYLNKYKKFPNP
ncbi:3-isopropylmalate dehydratase small subunit [Candidatus Acetothermia bacterium]|nr:3-isopropylmalate dehydratase small subunit [Candidatus Acetothermia bacterium]MBI3643929.1 3-isopropylmalate dehydratase small subunit [Candidatus Acetothermia bacterium]